jgi:transcriptional/translational regulatory protein YebC/TACO1
MEIALEAGAEDVREQEDQFEVITAVTDYEKVKAAFRPPQLEYELAEITKIPQTHTALKMTDRRNSFSN